MCDKVIELYTLRWNVELAFRSIKTYMKWGNYSVAQT
ncbi:MAG: transposase [Planctomycetaceae bacterium]|nr:transposase [Planctomycetaceae bacterium]